MFKKAEAFMKEHPIYNALTHALGGIGVGLLLAPATGMHAVGLGVTLIILCVLGHVYVLMAM